MEFRRSDASHVCWLIRLAADRFTRPAAESCPTYAASIVSQHDPDPNVAPGRRRGPTVFGVRAVCLLLASTRPVVLELTLAREPRHAHRFTPIDELARIGSKYTYDSEP